MGLVNALAERLRGDAVARRDKAITEYRELLLREAAPKKGDDERLVAVMEVLGRGPDDLSADAELVRQIAATEKLAALEGARCDAKSAANLEHQRVKQWAAAELARVKAKVEAEQSAAYNAWRAACDLHADSLRARQELPNLNLRLHALLTHQSPEALRDARYEERRAVNRTLSTLHVQTRHEILAALAERVVRQGMRPTAGVSIHTHVDDVLSASGEEPVTPEEVERYFGRLVPDRFDYNTRAAAVLPGDDRPFCWDGKA